MDREHGLRNPNDGMLLMDGVIFPDKFKKYETSISNEEMYIVISKFEKSTITTYYKSDH